MLPTPRLSKPMPPPLTPRCSGRELGRRSPRPDEGKKPQPSGTARAPPRSCLAQGTAIREVFNSSRARRNDVQRSKTFQKLSNTQQHRGGGVGGHSFCQPSLLTLHSSIFFFSLKCQGEAVESTLPLHRAQLTAIGGQAGVSSVRHPPLPSHLRSPAVSARTP